VIATGFANDGQADAPAGQTASDTSSNNFINFCLTAPALPLTNGQQLETGSCNPAPMGVIAGFANMPSAKFVSPANFDTGLQPNTPFAVTLALAQLHAGAFTNAETNFLAAPQTVDAAGDVVGHTHIVIEALEALNQTTPTDPTRFAFFKGVDTPAAADGTVTIQVAAGLPAGVYRMSTINTAANHQPVLVAVAQHGWLDDQIYVRMFLSRVRACAEHIHSSRWAAEAPTPSGRTVPRKPPHHRSPPSHLPPPPRPCPPCRPSPHPSRAPSRCKTGRRRSCRTRRTRARALATLVHPARRRRARATNSRSAYRARYS
jgi:hypothetical protein